MLLLIGLYLHVIHENSDTLAKLKKNSNHKLFVSSVIGGFLSDRLGRRKPLVIGSGTY